LHPDQERATMGGERGKKGERHLGSGILSGLRGVRAGGEVGVGALPTCACEPNQTSWEMQGRCGRNLQGVALTRAEERTECWGYGWRVPPPRRVSRRPMPDLRRPPKFPPKAREDGRALAAQSGSVSVVLRTGKDASAAERGGGGRVGGCRGARVVKFRRGL